MCARTMCTRRQDDVDMRRTSSRQETRRKVTASAREDDLERVTLSSAQLRTRLHEPRLPRHTPNYHTNHNTKHPTIPHLAQNHPQQPQEPRHPREQRGPQQPRQPRHQTRITSIFIKNQSNFSARNHNRMAYKAVFTIYPHTFSV